MDISILKERLDNSQYMYIYGAGLTGISYLQRFKQYLPSRPIKGIVVSEKKGNPERIGKFNVVSLSELLVQKENAFFGLRQHKSIKKIL